MTDLNPADIMAEHRDHHDVHYIDDLDLNCCACGLPEFGNRTCLPYRLAKLAHDQAAELAEERRVRQANSHSARVLMDAIRDDPAFPSEDDPRLFGERALAVIQAREAAHHDMTCLYEAVCLQLAVMRGRVADAWDAGWYARRVWRARLESHLDPATRGENISGPLPKPANPYRAALAGEGAAESRSRDWNSPHGIGADAVMDAPASAAVEDVTPSCSATVWDGPYSFTCGQGGGTGNCPRHGRRHIKPSSVPTVD